MCECEFYEKYKVLYSIIEGVMIDNRKLLNLNCCCNCKFYIESSLIRKEI